MMLVNNNVVSEQGALYRQDAHQEILQARKDWQAANDRLNQRVGITKGQMTDELKAGLAKQMRGDAAGVDFVARQLIAIQAQMKNTVYPGDILAEAFPINREGYGAKTLAYHALNLSGKFDLTAGTGSDSPEVASSIDETPTPIGMYTAYAGWSEADLIAAGFARTDISARKQMAILLAALKTKNQIAWTGDPKGGAIKGLFSYALNPVTIAGTWASATADAIVADVVKVASQTHLSTEYFNSDILVMDTTSFSFMNKPLGANASAGIGAYILNNTNIKAILSTSYLNSVTSVVNSLNNARVMLAYPKNPMVLEFNLAQDVTMLPIQQRLFQYLMPAKFHSAGTLLYYGGVTGPVAYATGM